MSQQEQSQGQQRQNGRAKTKPGKEGSKELGKAPAPVGPAGRIINRTEK